MPCMEGIGCAWVVENSAQSMLVIKRCCFIFDVLNVVNWFEDVGSVTLMYEVVMKIV